MSEAMTAGDVLTALDESVKMTKENFPSIIAKSGEDYAHGVLHGLSCLRAWLRSHEFDQYLTREKAKGPRALSTTETPT